MASQNFENFLINAENIGLYQAIILIFFIIFFISLIVLVFSKPRNHYQAVSESPLDIND